MVSTKVIGIFAAGVLLSPFLMPVILALIPVLIGLGCLLGAGIAYLVVAKGCRYRDFRFVAKGIWLKILIRLRGDKMVVPATFAKTMAEVGEHAPMITFVDDDKVYTYGDVDALSNQIARAMLAEKLGVGETVSLYMGNRPEYIATWLGVSKMGGRTALLNNNLRTKALLHGLRESQSKILIFDAASIDVIEESFEDIEAMGLKLFCYDEECDFAPCLVETMSELASSALPVEQTAAAKGVTVKDPVLYIFTSGTTGLPKAAVVTHFRYLYASLAFTLMFNYTKNDRVYTTMPLYHSAAGIIGVGSLIQTGCSMVLRSKFSKSQFVRDVRKYNCTIMQYIGELCRYLLAAPVTNYDSDTSLRLAIGNGLRPDIWDEFKTRFGIKQIGEFYAATEGAAALINTEDKKGSIGFLSPIIQLIQPQGCIEFSVEEEKPIRGADGLAKFCKPNQEGEFVAMIKVEKNGTSNFSGYTNKEASNKKIMTDVKTKGDRWFRSGDLLRIDEEGFVYFVDRIGDTFRWKGENVSTNEVAEIVAGYGFHEINVYGVKTPAGDGRAGMMSIVGVDPGTVDFEALAAYVSANLAKYARPIFIRFQEAMEVTGTFKHKKVELRNQGYDPTKCGGDPLFFYNGKSYEPLTEQLFADIEAGNVNL